MPQQEQNPYASYEDNPYAPHEEGTTPPVPTAIIKAAPKFLSKEGLKRFGYNAAESGLDLLPTAGGIAGGIAGAAGTSASGPGAIAGAAGGALLGGEAGEAARQIGKRALFGTGPSTSQEAAQDIAWQGFMQSLAELSGQATKPLFGPVTRYMEKTALRSAQTGVRLLPSEAHSATSSYLERFLKGSVMTSGKMEVFRTAQNAETKAATEQIADTISNWKGTREQLGKAIQDGIDAHIEDFRKLQNTMYSTIEQKAKGVVVPMKPLKDFAKEELVKLTGTESVLDPALLSSTRSMLENITKAPDNVPFSAMASARSDLLSLTRRLDEALPGKQSGLAKKLASLADESMMDAAKKSGVPGLEAQIRAANAFTAEEHRKFEQALVKKIVETRKPEAIATFLRQKSVGLQETRDLFNVLPQSLHAPVRKQVIVDAMKTAINERTGSFDERKFSTLIHNIEDDRGKELFGANNWGNIKQLAGLMGQINGPTMLGGGTGAALQNFSVMKDLLLSSVGLAAAPLGLLTSHHPVAAAMSVAGEWATLNTLAYAMTNPESAVKMLKVAQTFTKYLPYGLTAAINEVEGRKTRGAGQPTAGQQLRELQTGKTSAKPPGVQKRELEQMQRSSNPLMP